MLYYRVKPEFDNKPQYKTKYYSPTLHHNGIWIANELFTACELDRMEKNNIIVPKEYFSMVKIKKTETYWFFGARFSNDAGVTLPF